MVPVPTSPRRYCLEMFSAIMAVLGFKVEVEVEVEIEVEIEVEVEIASSFLLEMTVLGQKEEVSFLLFEVIICKLSIKFLIKQ